MVSICIETLIKFTDFASNRDVKAAVRSLNQTPWLESNIDMLGSISNDERKRLRKAIEPGNIFRGITKGDDVGPYISQFSLVGNTGLGAVNKLKDGFIQYGAQCQNACART